MRFNLIFSLIIFFIPLWTFSQQQELLLEVESESPPSLAFVKLQRQLKADALGNLERALINHDKQTILNSLQPNIDKAEVSVALEELKKWAGENALKILEHDEKKMGYFHLRKKYHRLVLNVESFDSTLVGTIEYGYTIVDSTLQINSWRLELSTKTEKLSGETEALTTKIIPAAFKDHLTLFQSFLETEDMDASIQLEKQLYESARKLKKYDFYFAEPLDALRIDIAKRFGFLANSFLYKKDLESAKKATNRIEKISPSIEPFTTILTLINLLTDEYDKAAYIATLYKTDWPSKHKAEVYTLNIRLDRLEINGFNHPNIEKLRQLINE